MQENFLHFVWRTGRFAQQNLRTTAGQSVSLFRRGIYDGHAGPDFTQAHLRIGDTVWHGHVEMHLFASEWYRHKHDSDPAYDGTVLHVVWEEDQPVFRRDGTRLPCLELKPLVSGSLLGRYQRLIHDGNGIPCRFRLTEVPELVRRSMTDRALIERLERRSAMLEETLRQQGGDWEQTVWIALAHGMGNPANADTMEQLARNLPLPLMGRYRHSHRSMDALVFGMAGLLDHPDQDPYPVGLATEWNFLRRKHGLHPLGASQWKYLRMRPVSFPDLRLARLAGLLVHQENWLANILQSASPKEWLHSLEVGLHPYWRRHYRFGVPSRPGTKSLGTEFGRSLVINVMVPVLYAYGRLRGEARWQERALGMLALLPGETNNIIRYWQQCGMPVQTAADSQALLELKTGYCTPRRCLHCAIGCFLLQPEKTPGKAPRSTETTATVPG